jgi:hypothetical protein
MNFEKKSQNTAVIEYEPIPKLNCIMNKLRLIKAKIISQKGNFELFFPFHSIS